MIEEIQAYLDEYHFLRAKFSKKDMERIAEHFGGKLTSGGRYVKIGEEEYRISMDQDTMRLKVEHMTWEHGNNFKYVYPY